MHPTLIISAYRQALEDAIRILEDQVAFDVDINDEKAMIKVIQSCIGTKFISRWAGKNFAKLSKKYKENRFFLAIFEKKYSSKTSLVRMEFIMHL